MPNYELFGQHTYRGEKSLLLVEGEEDAMAADVMLNGNTSQITLRTLCCSLATGANVKSLRDNLNFISKFNRVVYHPDSDAAGKKIVEDIASLLPDILFMDTTEKDANDSLSANKQVEFVTAYGKARKYRPPSIVNVSQVIGSVAIPLEEGLSYPWESVTKLTYGLVPHSIVSIGAGPGVGKSSVVRAIQQHIMFEHKEKVGVISLEDSIESTLKYFVGYIMGQKIHLPGAIYDTKKAMSIAETLDGRLFLFDNRYFKGDWSDIEKAMRCMYSDGVKFIFIDPVSALVAHLSASDGNTALSSVMIKMSQLVQEIPATIVLINHLNNPSTGKSHDEGARVSPSQFTGSRAQWRYSDELVGLERNILSEDSIEKNTLIWRQLKHRADGSKTGNIVRLKYNHNTGRLEEMGGFSKLPSPGTANPNPNTKQGSHTPDPKADPLPPADPMAALLSGGTAA